MTEDGLKEFLAKAQKVHEEQHDEEKNNDKEPAIKSRRRRLLSVPTAGLACVGWRQTGGCSPTGDRESSSDKDCAAVILLGESGYCECGDAPAGDSMNTKIGFPCKHDEFDCTDICAQQPKEENPYKDVNIDKLVKLVKQFQNLKTENARTEFYKNAVDVIDLNEAEQLFFIDLVHELKNEETQSQPSEYRHTLKAKELQDQAAADEILRNLGHPDREGCILAGHIEARKVPSSMQITAKSTVHDIESSNIDVSHTVSHLSFGVMAMAINSQFDYSHGAWKESRELSGVSKLHNRVFVSGKPRTSHEHFLKVVETQFNLLSTKVSQKLFQYSVTSHKYIEEAAVPAAKFTFDLDPMALVVIETKQPLFTFITHLCGILGGVFTVFGLIDGGVFKAVELMNKNRLGKTS